MVFALRNDKTTGSSKRASVKKCGIYLRFACFFYAGTLVVAPIIWINVTKKSNVLLNVK